jgi:hypothetical protein
MDFDFIKSFASTLPLAEKARLAQFLLTETVGEHYQKFLEQGYLPFCGDLTVWDQLEAAKQVPFEAESLIQASSNLAPNEIRVTRVPDQFLDDEFEEILYRDERERLKFGAEEFAKRWEGKTAEVWADIKYDIDLQFLPGELEQMQTNGSAIHMDLRENLPEPILLTLEEEKFLRP